MAKNIITNLTLDNVVYPTQHQLLNKLKKCFDKYYVRENGYLFIPGEAPVLLIAHLDTAHAEKPVIEKSENGNIWSAKQGIGGDDRCGVYGLLKVYMQTKIKPSLLFTCNEEIGCRGAYTFTEDYLKGEYNYLKDIKFIIELDRKGRNEAVYYNCDNKDFEEYITSKGFITMQGSCSDISVIAPEIGVAAVNLSAGYYNAHTKKEYIVVTELEYTIQKVIDIVDESTSQDIPRFEYVDMFNYDYDDLNDFGIYSFDNSCMDDVEYGFTDSEKKILHSLNSDLYDQYIALSYIYSIEELEAYRALYNDNIIYDIFEAEFGYRYNSYSPLEKMLMENFV